MCTCKVQIQDNINISPCPTKPHATITFVLNLLLTHTKPFFCLIFIYSRKETWAHMHFSSNILLHIHSCTRSCSGALQYNYNPLLLTTEQLRVKCSAQGYLTHSWWANSGILTGNLLVTNLFLKHLDQHWAFQIKEQIRLLLHNCTGDALCSNAGALFIL